MYRTTRSLAPWNHTTRPAVAGPPHEKGNPGLPLLVEEGRDAQRADGVVAQDIARGGLKAVGGPDLRVPLAIHAYRRKAAGSPVAEALWSVLDEPEAEPSPPPTKRAA